MEQLRQTNFMDLKTYCQMANFNKNLVGFNTCTENLKIGIESLVPWDETISELTYAAGREYGSDYSIPARTLEVS